MRNPKILVVERSNALARQVREVVKILRPRPEVAVCEKVGSFDDVVEDEGPFDVLIAGPSLANRSGLGRLALVHTAQPALRIILAFDDRPDANLREIVRTGAVDLMHLPVDDELLVETVERAVEMRRSAPESDFPRDPDAAPNTGSIFSVTSATGGCGKTFLSTNLAYFLHRRTRRPTCLVDLDLQFGEIPTALRLKPRYTIMDVIRRDDAEDSDLDAQIDQYLVAHDTGVHVLAAPKDPSDADAVEPQDVIRILQALRCRFDHVVVDTPPLLNEIVLAALDLSDHVFVMATLDMPSIRNMSVFLSTLEKLKISSDDVRLVLNKVETEIGLDVGQVLDLFPQFRDGASTVLRYAKEVSRSLNMGAPLLAFIPGHDVSRALTKGLSPLVPPDRVFTGVEEPTRRSLLSRLVRRSPAMSGDLS